MKTKSALRQAARAVRRSFNLPARDFIRAVYHLREQVRLAHDAGLDTPEICRLTRSR